MNVLRKTIGLAALVAMTFCTINVDAQPTKQGAEQTVTQFASSFEKVPQTGDVDQVLSHVSKDLFSTIINSSVADNFGLVRSTYQDFEGFLNSLKGQKDLSIQYDVENILKTNVRGKSAVVVCDIAYQYKKGNVIQRKGREATTFVLRYMRDSWKIINFNVVNMEEELNVGQCVCEVFTANTGNYMTKTTVPAGDSYEKKIDEFEINRGQGGVYYISVNGNDYTWIRDGNIKKIDRANNKETIIGSAVDELEAVLTIAENDLYNEKCTEFRRRRY